MFYLVQAGAALKVLTTRGNVYTTIVLPAGVTVDATKRARFVTLLQKVYVFNAVSKNIFIDPATFTAYLLGLLPAAAAGTASAGAAGVLTGDYSYTYTFIQKDGGGNVIDESPPAPVSNVITLAAQKLHGTIAILPAGTWTGRRIYRTASGGSDYFQSIDIDDAVSTTFDDNSTDNELGNLVLDLTVVNAPGGSDGASQLTQVVEWKNYLWAVASQADNVDTLWRSGLNQPWWWSAQATFPASPKGADAFGITALAARRDALGVAKRDKLIKITGSSDQDFQDLTVVEKYGCVAADSIVVVRDTVYWLGSDGVYCWSDAGVQCMTRKRVDPWFAGDDEGNDVVFDRSQFSKALGGWNPLQDTYELHLVPIGGSDPTAWISIGLSGDLADPVILGPHLTSAFTPSARGLLRSDDAVFRPAMGGSDGFLYLENQPGSQDVDGPTSTAHAIDAFFTPRLFHNGDPNMTHFWGRLTTETRVESSGTLTVTPTLMHGVDDATAADPPFTIDLTKGRQIQTSPTGVSELLKLKFEQNTAGKRFLLFGFKITPVNEVGIR